MDDHPTDTPAGPPATAPVSRRTLLAGLGAVGGGSVLVGLPAVPASARPMMPAAPAAPTGATIPLPVSASSPEEGVTYRFLDLYSFSSVDGAGPRTWGSRGAYTKTVAGTLFASLDLAPGAVVHDVEWYVGNGSSAPVEASARLWLSGSPAVSTPIALSSIPPGREAAQPTRTLVVPDAGGPFPHGVRLLLGVNTPATGQAGVVGVRVGFRPGPLSTILLPAPTRIYDSRSGGGPMAPGSTRQVSLAAKVPAGAVGAIVNLTVIGTNGRGSIRLGKGGATPTATSLQWSRTGDQVTTSASTNISLARTIALQTYAATGATDVVVDLVGYLV